MLGIAKRFLLLFGLWLVLTLNEPSAWFIGAMTAGLGTAASMRLAPSHGRELRLMRALALFPGFLWRSFVGGLDVAWRAFHPRMPLQPQWISYPVRLPAGGPRVAFGNGLSLMPGTLAAGVAGDVLYVHCLDGERAVEAEIAKEEMRIAESAGLPLEQSHG